MIAAILAAGTLFAAAPTVADGSVTLELGQSVTLQVGPDGPRPADPGVLSENKMQFSGDAVRFALSGRGEMIMLMINNGYGEMVGYDAEIFAADGRHARTNVCPAIAHITGVESWQAPVVKIRLSNFRLLPKDGPRVCD